MATQRVAAPTWRDALVAVTLCAADVLTQWTSGASTRWVLDASMRWEFVVAYAATGYVALVFRRVWPGPVFVVMCVHSIAAQLLSSYRPFLGVLVAFYTVCALVSRRQSLLALAAMVVVSGLAVRSEVMNAPVASRDIVLLVDTLLFAALIVAIWWVGRRVGSSARQIDQLERHREEDARAAVADERGRIARDLHDIVAHSVTVMVLQAAGARRIGEQRGPAVEHALTDIELAGRQAMSELRRLLGVLRPVDAATDGGDGRPPPGLGDVPDVVERISTAGLPVTLERRGTERALDSSVGLAAHRVVTEGLTNSLKYAPPGARGAVVLEWDESGLTVTVTNDDGGRAGVGGDGRVPVVGLSSGRGLIGLAERVRSVGGWLDAGPEPTGGFRVRATLPVPPEGPSVTSGGDA
ncbi:sensor histidine kinase [Cellulomonas fengjieae]|uniref:sensor histidine kinase n=1 Tax=Cellulomonas fengjieae TaxID=2819978 RepID=UPI001AAF87FB|nr:histidine kinase [Cellulomonas fengjieae]MBO3103497.1 hypothetical protein [Cellulomonas fengjieae]